MREPIITPDGILVRITPEQAQVLALTSGQSGWPVLDANTGSSLVRFIAWCRSRLTVDEQRAVHLALADACDKGQPQDGCLCHERGWQAAEAQAAREAYLLERGFNLNAGGPAPEGQ